MVEESLRISEDLARAVLSVTKPQTELAEERFDNQASSRGPAWLPLRCQCALCSDTAYFLPLLGNQDAVKLALGAAEHLAEAVLSVTAIARRRGQQQTARCVHGKCERCAGAPAGVACCLGAAPGASMPQAASEF